MNSLCSSPTKEKADVGKVSVDVGKVSAVEYKEDQKIADIQCTKMTSLCPSSKKQKIDIGKVSAVEYKEDEKIADIQFGMAGIFDNIGASMTDGNMLVGGQMLVSESNMFCARMQRDGNFVIYRGYSGPIWASNTGNLGTSPYQLRMQSDGNLRVYPAGDDWTWSAQLSLEGTGPFKLIMQDNGNLVIYDADGQTTWTSPNTCYTLNTTLTCGSALTDGQYLLSSSGQFQAVMNTNGNFVLYELQYGPVLIQTWSSNITHVGKGPFKLKMKSDGNLVIYDTDTNKSAWSSITAGKGSGWFKLWIRNDGNLVIDDGDWNQTWATNTSRTWSSVLEKGNSISSNEFLTSKNHTCTAAMRSDGNFCIYKGGLYCVWKSQTTGSGPFTLTLQDDGDLVIHNCNGETTWTSNTAGSGVINAELHDDGSLTINFINNVQKWIWRG